MLRDDVIEAGDAVDLMGEKNRVYRTKIEDVIESVLFLVNIPKHGGVPMPLFINDVLTMIFYRDSGRYVVRVRVAGFEKKAEVRYVLLLLESKPQQDQRRGAYRQTIKIKSQVCEYIEGIEKRLLGYWDVEGKTVLETVGSRDISVTGVAIITRREYKSGEKYLLRLYFNEHRNKMPPFFICGRVMRSIPWRESGMNSVGMQFFGHTREMSDYIAKQVLEEQRRQISERKRIEGN